MRTQRIVGTFVTALLLVAGSGTSVAMTRGGSIDPDTAVHLKVRKELGLDSSVATVQRVDAHPADTSLTGIPLSSDEVIVMEARARTARHIPEVRASLLRSAGERFGTVNVQDNGVVRLYMSSPTPEEKADVERALTVSWEDVDLRPLRGSSTQLDDEYARIMAIGDFGCLGRDENLDVIVVARSSTTTPETVDRWLATGPSVVLLSGVTTGEFQSSRDNILTSAP